MFAAASIFLLEDGKLDIQEEDGHNSFSLGSGHDSILQFAEWEDVEEMSQLVS
jgi:hypothetical protein